MHVRDVDAMKEGVQNSNCLIAIVTDDGTNSYFSRQMCRQEIEWAEEFEKQIVPVCATMDKQKITEFIEAGKKHKIDFSKFNFVVHLAPHAMSFLVSVQVTLRPSFPLMHRTSTARRRRASRPPSKTYCSRWAKHGRGHSEPRHRSQVHELRE